jgi:hypothetical protein
MPPTAAPVCRTMPGRGVAWGRRPRNKPLLHPHRKESMNVNVVESCISSARTDIQIRTTSGVKAGLVAALPL